VKPNGRVGRLQRKPITEFVPIPFTRYKDEARLVLGYVAIHDVRDRLIHS